MVSRINRSLIIGMCLTGKHWSELHMVSRINRSLIIGMYLTGYSGEHWSSVQGAAYGIQDQPTIDHRNALWSTLDGAQCRKLHFTPTCIVSRIN